jgi:heat shock protein HtpX
MWELIRKNRRKSFILFIMMGICLLLMGYLLGEAFWGPGGGLAGLTLAFVIWAILSLVSYFSGDSIMLNMAGAKEVTPDVHPQLFNVVEEMKIAGSLPAMPKVYIIDTAAPNAFATGRNPENSAIAVTAGLLNRLNRDELQGVVAHEMSHILNRDILFMTFASVMLGSIMLLSRVFLHGGRVGGSRRIRSKKSSGGGGIPIVAIIAIIFAILAPILAHVLYMAISRQREYLADASAVRLSRYPEGLASALEKISKTKVEMPNVNKVTAPLYISPPFTGKEMKASGGGTHPPIKERIKILRAMSHGADYAQYQNAYQSVTGKSELIPPGALKESQDISIRSDQKAAPGIAAADNKTDGRELTDLMRAVNQYLFIPCVCGLKIKLPPDFKKSEFNCPRCARKIRVPVAEMATAAVVLDQLQAKDKIAAETEKSGQPVYHRKGTGWESFSCTCGNKLQLSPAFEGDKVKCGKCGTQIKIEKS